MFVFLPFPLLCMMSLCYGQRKYKLLLIVALVILCLHMYLLFISLFACYKHARSCISSKLLCDHLFYFYFCLYTGGIKFGWMHPNVKVEVCTTDRELTNDFKLHWYSKFYNSVFKNFGYVGFWFVGQNSFTNNFNLQKG